MKPSLNRADHSRILQVSAGHKFKFATQLVSELEPVNVKGDKKIEIKNFQEGVEGGG